jgi:hypothetical protein
MGSTAWRDFEVVGLVERPGDEDADRGGGGKPLPIRAQPTSVALGPTVDGWYWQAGETQHGSHLAIRQGGPVVVDLDPTHVVALQDLRCDAADVRKEAALFCLLAQCGQLHGDVERRRFAVVLA